MEKKTIYIKNIKSASMLVDFLDDNSLEYDYQSDFQLITSKKSTRDSKKIMLIALITGFFGFFATIFFQQWAQTAYYPLNIGNRPMFSLITALPYAFEIAVLFASVSAFIVFLSILAYSGKSVEKNKSDSAIFIINKIDFDKCLTFCMENNINFELDEKEN